MDLTILLATVVLAAVSYLLGSVSFAVIFTNHYAHTDVRDHGSGNAGMTNVLRTAGKKPAVFTFICDFLKGVATAAIGKYLMLFVLKCLGRDLYSTVDPLYFAYLAGLFCIVGHIYPLYFSFKGGKGVSATAGIFLVLDWRVLLIALGIFIIIMLITGIVSLGSVLAALSLPISTYFLYNSGRIFTFELLGLPQHLVITLLSALFAAIVIIKHIPNIKRLLKGEEKRIFGKGKNKKS